MNPIERNRVHRIGEQGPVLLYAHGFGCHQGMWAGITPAFASSHSQVLMDYTGSGPTDGFMPFDTERYSRLEGYAQDLLEVCDALALRRGITLVAHSVSCSIGMLAALARPGLFERMILIGPSPCFLNHPPDYLGGFERADLEGLLALMDQNYLGWANYLAPVVAGEPAGGETGAELERSFCSTDPETARVFARATFFADNRADLPKLRCPSLILQHARDALAPLSVGQFLHQHLADSELQVLDVSGHCAHMSHPDLVIEAMRRYLAQPHPAHLSMSAPAPSLDPLPCAVLQTDGDGRVRYGNAALRGLVGDALFSRAELHLDELLPPASRIFLQTHVWPLLHRLGRVEEIQLQLRGADGLARPVLLNASCDRLGASPSAMQVSWVFFVTAERQRFEAELLQTRQRLENLLLSANAGTWEWNVQTGALKVNARWAGILGRLGELGKLELGWRSAQVHPDDAAVVQASLEALQQGQQAEHLKEFRMRRPDARWVWVQERGRLISRLPDGRPEWVFGTLIDISESMAQRTALRRSETLLNRTNALAGVGGWELDLRSQEVYWSEQTCRIHGVPTGYRPRLDEALAFYPAESRPQIEAAVQRAIATGSGWDLELPFELRDGSRRVVRALGAVELEAGNPVRLLGALQDVTEQHRLTRALRHAKAAAEAASEAKSMFLANMSHEIRTPMNAVIGIARLLADSPLDEDQRQLLGKLQLAGRSLMAVIDDVLDLAKIEAGALAVEMRAYNPAELGQELDALFAEQARAKGLRWRLTISSELPATLRGDPQRLHQVLGNLLSNAIKFTAQGEVSLHIEPLAAGEGEERLRLTVRDSGIGIAPEAQARLFQPFVQAEASTTRRFGGTGLGLSIAKRLVELMGGSLSLRSAPGQGSEFSVLLRCSAAMNKPSTGHRACSAASAGLRLLVIDDSEINLEVAQRLLQRQGAAVQCESQAELALARLRGGECFDAVLMDIQMPGMDGLQATRQIRQDLQLLELPVIALTAGALVEERRRAAEAGMDDFLTKPLDPETLVRCVRRHVEARCGVPLPVAQPHAAGAAGDWLPADWPQIEGIEAEEAAQRLGGDAALFRRLLARLLKLHDADWRQRLAQQDAQRQAAELHKLRGTAGMLGARRLHALATEAEEGLRAGLQSQALGALLDGLGQTLSELALAAQGQLHEPDRTSTELPVDAEQAFAELLSLLQQQDLGAAEALVALMPWFAQHGMRLRDREQLLGWVQELDYEPALRWLGAWQPDRAA